MCCDPDDYKKDFESSGLCRVIDKHANTITLYVTIPPSPLKTKMRPNGTISNGPKEEGFEDNFVNANDGAGSKSEEVNGQVVNGEVDAVNGGAVCSERADDESAKMTSEEGDDRTSTTEEKKQEAALKDKRPVQRSG